MTLAKRHVDVFHVDMSSLEEELKRGQSAGR